MWLIEVDIGRGETPVVVDGIEKRATMLAAVQGGEGLQLLPGFIGKPVQLGRCGVVELVEPGVVAGQSMLVVGGLH